ncbi:MAG TPA: PAS domain S-box protein, partial [Pyrinomonadaceae bacterium]|nr:PAS domain S-box protein [Pyrinomonadaceae bacterium]
IGVISLCLLEALLIFALLAQRARRSRAEQENRNLIHSLGERVKELTALHHTARVLHSESKSVPKLLQGIVELLPPAWQYPEVTAARITFGYLEFKTANFASTPWSQKAQFEAGGSRGVIEVLYLEERPEEHIGPFLLEERNLIDSLAEMISSALNRRFTQDELRASEERFTKAFQASPVPIAILNDRDRTFLEVNESWETVFGYNREETVGRTALELNFFNVEDRDRLRALGESQGVLRDEELDVRTKHGETRHVTMSAERFMISGELCNLCIFRDITERKRAEEALRESERRFSDSLKNIEMIAVMADMKGDITFCNDYLLRLTGWKREETIGRNWYEMFLPEGEKAKVSKLLDRVEPTGEVVVHMENEIKTRSGERRLVMWTNTTLRGLDGQVIGVAALGDDITERKAAEGQLKSSTAQLRALSARLQSAREEEGTRIAREIHDELGSALTGLKWDLERIDKALPEAENGGEIHSVHQRILTMTGLVDTTINTVRRISSELRPGVLDNLGLIPAIEWHAQQVQERTGIICSVDSLIEHVDLNREQTTAVFRIFQEAMTNVLRHAQATKVTIIIEEDDGEFIVEIKDNGRGITESERSGIHSLGLVGMRERANSVGGKVQINRVAGKGTAVIVRLPIKSDLDILPALEKSSGPATSHRGGEKP